jgi:hypothetical protein
MKPIAWMAMAACVALSACGGGNDVSSTKGSSSTSTTPGSPSNPSSPGGGSTSGSTHTQAGWSAVAALDGNAGESEPAVTVDAKGNAVATWLTLGTSAVDTNEIWGSRYVPGQGWGTATRLDTTDGSVNMTGPGVSPPQVVGNANGRALALWVQWTPGPNEYALWARPYDPASGWGTPVQVTPDVTSAAYTAGVDANGNALVAWSQGTTSGASSIEATRYTTDGKWAPTVTIPEPAQTGPNAVIGPIIRNIAPNIAVTPAGNAVIAWQQTNTTQSALWTATYDPTNGWTNSNPAVTEVYAGPKSVFSPAVGMDSKGNITLVWGEVDIDSAGAHTTTMSQRYAAGSGWQAGQPVAPFMNMADVGYYPVLNVNPDGVALVAWYGPDAALYANVSDTNGKWGTTQQLSLHPDLLQQRLPQLALDDTGNATVAWGDSGTPGSTDVLASRYSGGAWSAPTLFGQHPQGTDWPALGGSSSGTLALLWILDVYNVGTEVRASFYTPGS